MELNKGVRCGNHNGARFYHETAADVRECYEWTRAVEAELPAWITDEDPTFVRPAASAARPMRGWWDLPMAASMWGADAASIER